MNSLNDTSFEYLPLGSVVYVNQGTKKLMITGRLMCNLTTGNLNDYSAVLYPEGLQTTESTYLFNHDEIREVIHTGYSDREEEQFLPRLKTVKEKHANPHASF